MSIRYVVPNFSARNREVVEVFSIEQFYTIDGRPTDDIGEAVFGVVRDGGCQHRLDLRDAYVYTVH